MNLVLFNISWMTLNSSLALIAVALGWCMVKTTSPILRLFFAIAWLLFMPNTLYIVTDIKHIPLQVTQAQGGELVIILCQYVGLLAIGLISYVAGLVPFELLLSGKKKLKKGKANTTVVIAIILLNFIIGFGIVLGRIHRLHSWYVISDTQAVIDSAFTTLATPSDIAFAILMGVLGSFLYFSLRKRILPHL